MDELGALIEKLEGEVAALAAAIDARKADEERVRVIHESRVAAAKARVALTRAQLKSDGAALATLEDRRADLRRRIEGWRGQLWRLGYGSAAMVLVVGALTPFPLVDLWFGAQVALGLAAAQVGLFVGAFFLIPEKR